jgi:TolB-like protein/Flp pilus assembly protein TadD
MGSDPRRSALCRLDRENGRAGNRAQTVKIDKFFFELKRRNVYKVAVAYVIAGWALAQGIAQVFPVFDIPNWVVRLIVLLIIIGLPIALGLAWAFELTPQGIKRTETADAMPGTTRQKKHTWIYVVVIGGLFSIGLFFLGRYSAATRQPQSPSLPAKSIAVLPFDNLSRDPDNAYFAEGVQDEILTRLAKVADLKVISRTSTQHFKSAPENLPQIAKQLGVLNILEGSVQKSNDQVRVNVQLINALTDAHLWADTYDRKLTDIFAVESDIAKTIAETLRAKLTGAEQAAIAARPTENSEAYELYLRGRYFLAKRESDDLQRGIAYFNQAIAKDPKYAPAYAGLADAYTLLLDYANVSWADTLPKARGAAEKALALDDSLAEAHVSLALVWAQDGLNLEKVEPEYRRAIELNPNYAAAHYFLALSVLSPRGQCDQAVAEMKRALELDPFSVIMNANLGYIYHMGRRYPEAIAQLHKAAELNANFSYTHLLLGFALEMNGDLTEAMKEYEKVYAIEKADELKGRNFGLAVLAHVYGRQGNRDRVPRPGQGSRSAARQNFRLRLCTGLFGSRSDRRGHSRTRAELPGQGKCGRVKFSG